MALRRVASLVAARASRAPSCAPSSFGPSLRGGVARHCPPRPPLRETHSRAEALRVPDIEGSAYTILGVSEEADARTIKSAYIRLARMWHPDVSGHHDATRIFPYITLSNEILKDEDQRMLYDFILKEKIPLLHTPQNFQATYPKVAWMVPYLKYRDHFCWFLVALLGGALALARGREFLRPVGDRSDPPPPLPALASLLCTTLLASASALQGVSGRAGAYLVVGAACTGAFIGRIGIRFTFVDLDRLTLARERGVRWLVANSRVLCELTGGLIAILLFSRGSALPWKKQHFRSLRVGLLGALFGHAMSRITVFNHEIALARPPNVAIAVDPAGSVTENE
ncbi:hypothetical protein AB1Y20_000511 [Prymnesium parvum]|uniref:J domain-containing protein n=1 Tax=Prymnesium parvum TaxID=97485 RepID=A0AB34K865_PRYPA